jgi:hypothetical protein
VACASSAPLIRVWLRPREPNNGSPELYSLAYIPFLANSTPLTNIFFILSAHQVPLERTRVHHIRFVRRNTCGSEPMKEEEKKKKEKKKKERVKIKIQQLRIMSGKERPDHASLDCYRFEALATHFNVQRACLSEEIQRIVFTKWCPLYKTWTALGPYPRP